MTDLEISKALALAIGWEEKDFMPFDTHLAIHKKHHFIKVFDYRDWNVIGPIAARHDCFPFRWFHNSGTPCWRSDTDTHQANADTPQKAIALAVIGVKK